MNRRIEGQTRRSIAHPSVPTDDDLVAWLAQQGQAYELRWLLAHTVNGVIWGELRDTQLHLSSDGAAFARPALALTHATLRRCRLFGPTGELLVWSGPQIGAQPPSRAEGLRARLFRDDDAGADTSYLSEDYLLFGWGDARRDGFVELVEGEQGIVHSPPLPAPVAEDRRASVRVRHYLMTDAETGQVRIETSRMVTIVSPNSAM